MVNESKRVLIIAEAGVNHNGSLDMALEMVKVASDAGADMVKFQTFKPELMISRHAAKADYQKDTTGTAESQLDMVRKYELSLAQHEKLFSCCKDLGIEFFSTPFDLQSVDLLVNLGVKRIKIPSGEITNWPLIHKIGTTGKPVIMSTGMSTLDEIRDALGIYLMGALRPQVIPDRNRLNDVYVSQQGQDCLKNRVVLLHCTTQYPTPYEDVNLKAMNTLKGEFGVSVGYSDHTEGIAVSIAAVARGAEVIEKHFTLDKELPGPDHKASIEPGELRDLVTSARVIEKSLGSGEKRVTSSEMTNRMIVRKSLTALTDIKEGEVFTRDNLGTKRPADGVSAIRYWEYLGSKSKRSYGKDEQILPIGDHVT